MPRFSVGDKVRIVNYVDDINGKTGLILADHADSIYFEVGVLHIGALLLTGSEMEVITDGK